MIFNEICNTILEKVDLKDTTVKDYNPKMIKKGSAVEKEHTDDQKKAEKIAMQHTAEYAKLNKDGKIDTDYYEELDKMEADLKSKQKNTFEEIIKQMLAKENTSVTGGVFGDSPEIGAHGGDVANSDWYAPGDARNIFGGTNSNKKSKKKKGKKMGIMPLLRRNMGVKS
jgi:hypothetical protein